MAKKGRKRAADAGAPPEAAAGPSQRAEEMTELEYERAAMCEGATFESAAAAAAAAAAAHLHLCRCSITCGVALPI